MPAPERAFSELNGISQLPFAVEAVFGVDSYQFEMNPRTRELTNAGYQYRPDIQKRKDAPVRTNIFLDPKFSAISAIWAVDLNGTSVVGNLEPLVVVHNPIAKNAIPLKFLPAHNEYVMIMDGVKKIDGSLTL